MKCRNQVLRVGIAICLLLCVSVNTVRALSPPALSGPQGLSIVELKVTGSEFVVLQNNTGADITDLSSYALYYFNNYNPFASGVSSSTAFLPPTTLGVGQALLLSADPQATCGASVAGDLGLSLGDSSGFLEVVKLSNQNGAVAQQAGDVVSWSSGSNGVIQNVPSNTKDPAALWYRYQDGDVFAWQYADVDSANSCQLNAVVTTGTTKTTTPISGLLVASDDIVPGTIISLAAVTESAQTSDSASLPVADIGLKAPKISELLPNVAAPGSDDTDEFIELYNPNDKAFDLSGFSLQTGSTTSATRHTYILPAGTTLPPKGFKAFYSAQTGLSLSNTGGQAWLLDPFDTSIGQSDPYSKPKDGVAWATANGSWYYTTTPTPGTANVIKVPTVAAPKASTSKSTKAKTSTGAAVTALNKNGQVAGASTTAAYAADPTKTVPIHPATLAVVVALALLYWAYEYRHDLANRYHELRSNRSARA